MPSFQSVLIENQNDYYNYFILRSIVIRTVQYGVPVLKINRSEVDIIIVGGKSGAGKQPRIDVLVDLFNLKQLSTGNIFREYLGLLKNLQVDLDLDEFWDEENQIFINNDEIIKKLEDK